MRRCARDSARRSRDVARSCALHRPLGYLRAAPPRAGPAAPSPTSARMSIMSDRWITQMAREHGMIEPFEDRQVREGVISYGVSSYGYDMRVAREFRIFTNVLNSIVDPEELRSEVVRRVRGRRLHRAAELVRAGALGRVLPHPAQRPHGDRRQVDVRAVRDHHERHAVRAGVGRLRDARDLEHHAAAREDLRERRHRAGAVLRGEEEPEVSYKDKKGKYQGQLGVTLPTL